VEDATIISMEVQIRRKLIKIDQDVLAVPPHLAVSQSGSGFPPVPDNWQGLGEQCSESFLKEPSPGPGVANTWGVYASCEFHRGELCGSCWPIGYRFAKANSARGKNYGKAALLILEKLTAGLAPRSLPL
jgi:hypothetical protein